METETTASVIFAAGKGSRMSGFKGNKTLLPLEPTYGIFKGERPLLLEVLGNLPPGPKALVVNHCKEDIIKATAGMNLDYLDQPVTNGTGGALLAAKNFLTDLTTTSVIITMGDVPLVERDTYHELLDNLRNKALVVLSFSPKDRRRYGALIIEGDRVMKITEWKYWNDYSQEQQENLTHFNAGIYAFNLPVLIPYLDKLKANPHKVKKERNGKTEIIKEFFITDLVEYMNQDDLFVGFVQTKTEHEVMGVDTPESLKQAQARYQAKINK